MRRTRFFALSQPSGTQAARLRLNITPEYSTRKKSLATACYRPTA